MADKIDQLEIEISASSVDAAKQVNELADAMNRLKKSLGGTWKNPIPKVSGSSATSSAQSIQPQDAAGVAKEADEARGKVTRLVEEKGKLKQSTKLRIDSKDADKATGKLASLWGAIKRIAFYRAIRSALKALAAAFKEGLENAYEYSRLVGGELAPALDRIASASLQAKNQLGAAWGQVLQALEPIIVQLLHLVTKLAQGFTWLFAVLSGSDTYLVANEVATSWKEADKAAKAYRRTLLGIDEINRLNDPSSGGGTTPDYASMFHEEPTGYKLPDLSAWARSVFPWIDDLKAKLDAACGTAVELAGELLGIPSPEVTVSVLGVGAALITIGALSAALANLPAFVPIAIAVTLGVALAASQERIRQEVEQLELPELAVELNVESALQSGSELAAKLAELRSFSPINVALGLTGNRLVFQVAEEVKTILQELIGLDPITIGVRLKADDPQPEVNKIKEAQQELQNDTEPTKSKFAQMGEKLRSVFAEMASKYANTQTKMAQQNAKMTSGFAQAYESVRKNTDDFSTHSDRVYRTWATNTTRFVNPTMGGFASIVYSALQNAGNNVTDFVNKSSESVKAWAENGINSVAAWGKGFLQTTKDTLSSSWDNLKRYFTARGEAITGSYSPSGSVSVPSIAFNITTAVKLALSPFTGGMSLAFANGGFPEDGLFFANHGELVGKFANGRTAVANNQQITEGIADAVYKAFMEAFASTGGNSGSDDRAVNIYLDGKQIATTTTRYQRQYARAMGV